MTITYGDIYPTAVMTANDAPYDDASASSENSSSYRAWEAFNQYIYVSSGSCWISNNTAPTVGAPQWLKYHFDTSVTITAFKFKPRYSASGSYPKDFVFQGSNNDSDWTTLLTVTDYTDIANIYDCSDLFVLDSTGSYSYYRIYITEAQSMGSGTWVGIATLELFGQYAPATPYMLGYSSPSGVVSANGDYGSGWEAWRAFDGQRSNTYCWLSPNVAPSEEAPHWLKYQFDSAQTILAYAFRVRYDPARNFPSTFKLQGSNNDSDWDDLHSVTDMDDPGQGELTDIYNISSPDSYVYYRLLITDMTKVGSALNWAAINDFLLIKEMVAPAAEGWAGKICGVTNPSKICGIDVADIAKVCGV